MEGAELMERVKQAREMLQVKQISLFDPTNGREEAECIIQGVSTALRVCSTSDETGYRHIGEMYEVLASALDAAVIQLKN